MPVFFRIKWLFKGKRIIPGIFRDAFQGSPENPWEDPRSKKLEKIVCEEKNAFSGKFHGIFIKSIAKGVPKWPASIPEGVVFFYLGRPWP